MISSTPRTLLLVLALLALSAAVHTPSLPSHTLHSQLHDANTHLQGSPAYVKLHDSLNAVLAAITVSPPAIAPAASSKIFNISAAECQQLTASERSNLNTLASSVQAKLAQLQTAVATLPVNAGNTQLRIDLQNQQTYSAVFAQLPNSKCSSNITLAPSAYQTNVNSQRWILGGWSIADLQNDYVQRSLNSQHVTNCPLEAPFLSSAGCIDCLPPNNFFNIQTEVCVGCPVGKTFGLIARNCIQLPSNDSGIHTPNNTVSGGVAPIPKDTGANATTPNASNQTGLPTKINSANPATAQTTPNASVPSNTSSTPNATIPSTGPVISGTPASPTTNASHPNVTTPTTPNVPNTTQPTTPTKVESTLPNTTNPSNPTKVESVLPTTTHPQTPTKVESVLPNTTHPSNATKVESALPNTTNPSNPTKVESVLPTTTHPQTPTKVESVLPNTTHPSNATKVQSVNPSVSSNVTTPNTPNTSATVNTPVPSNVPIPNNVSTSVNTTNSTNATTTSNKTNATVVSPNATTTTNTTTTTTTNTTTVTTNTTNTTTNTTPNATAPNTVPTNTTPTHNTTVPENTIPTHNTTAPANKTNATIPVAATVPSNLTHPANATNETSPANAAKPANTTNTTAPVVVTPSVNATSPNATNATTPSNATHPATSNGTNATIPPSTTNATAPSNTTNATTPEKPNNATNPVNTSNIPPTNHTAPSNASASNATVPTNNTLANVTNLTNANVTNVTKRVPNITNTASQSRIYNPAYTAPSSPFDVPCPLTTPFFNGKDCIDCASPNNLFDSSKQLCFSCDNTSFFNATSHNCQPSPPNATNPSSFNKLLIPNGQLPIHHPSDIPCPPKKPFYNGSACVICNAPSYLFDISKKSCEACPDQTRYNETTHKCDVLNNDLLVAKNASRLVNAGMPTSYWNQEYDTLAAQNKNRKDCPAERPFYNGVACINCTNDTPYFNLETRSCESCNGSFVYDHTRRDCIDMSQSDFSVKPSTLKMSGSLFAHETGVQHFFARVRHQLKGASAHLSGN